MESPESTGPGVLAYFLSTFVFWTSTSLTIILISYLLSSSYMEGTTLGPETEWKASVSKTAGSQNVYKHVALRCGGKIAGFEIRESRA